MKQISPATIFILFFMTFVQCSLVAGIDSSRMIEYLTDYYENSDTHKELSSIVGVAETQGLRSSMEDAHHIEIGDDYAFFGLYDGHGGSQVADFAAQYLHHNINIGEQKTTSSIEEALKHAFIKTHNDLDSASFDVQNQGCTALVALLCNNRLFVANAGDSRAVVGNAGKAEPFSQDHKPNELSEKERIEKLGGTVVMGGRWDVPRVNGNLATSRALGDKLLNPWVTPHPEIIHRQLTPEDDFLILACDGVWDVMDNQTAVDIVKKALEKDVTNLEGAAELLKKNALRRESGDNISVIVVDLKKFQQNNF